MIIISITGKKHSGKSTLSKMIAKNLSKKMPNRVVLHMAFGDKVKSMLLEAGICSHSSLYKKKTKRSRNIMQQFGTEIVRNQIDNNYWCKALLARIKNAYLHEPECIVVIDDTRFLNEWQMLLKLNAFTVNIKRPLEDQEDQHQSEAEQDTFDFKDYDWLVNNNATKNDLEKDAKEVVEYVFWFSTPTVPAKHPYPTNEKHFKEVEKLWK